MHLALRMLILIAGVALLSSPPVLAAAEPMVNLIWTDAAGTTYYLSTGSSDGICLTLTGNTEVDDRASCFSSISGYASATIDGCGAVGAHGTCVILNELGDPRPLGTTSVKCADGTIYTVSDGGSGQCPPVDKATNGGSVSCSQQGTSNFASADCTHGCGNVSGTGSCTVK